MVTQERLMGTRYTDFSNVLRFPIADTLGVEILRPPEGSSYGSFS